MSLDVRVIVKLQARKQRRYREARRSIYDIKVWEKMKDERVRVKKNLDELGDRLHER